MSSRLVQDVEKIVRSNGTGEPPGMAGPIPGNLAIALIDTGKNIPKWWSRSRDKALERIVYESNHLSGIAFTALSKLSSVPISFVPYDPTISSHLDEAAEFTALVHAASQNAEGLVEAIKRFAMDYLIKDNGGFMEVLGEGSKDDPAGPIVGTPTGVRHLDSDLCTRTGDPIWPVRFDYSGNRRYKLHFSRVIYAAQMPSGRSTLSGIGFSSASRSNMLGQILTDQLVWKMERMGTRPTPRIIVGRGLEADMLMAGFAVANEIMNQMGLERYGINVYFGGDDIDVITRDLNNFELFNEEVGTRMAMYAAANSWGLKIQDIWPVTGSKSSDEVSNMQSRGRLPADFFSSLIYQFNFKLCPPNLRTLVDVRDDLEDQQRAIIEDIRSRKVERMAKHGLLDSSAQQRIMVQDGELEREEFIRLQLANGMLEDGTPIGVLFHSEDRLVSQLLTLEGVEYPLWYEDNDPAVALREIHVQQDACYQAMVVRSTAQRRRAQQAHAALCWLESIYQTRMNKPDMTPADDAEEQETIEVEDEPGYDDQAEERYDEEETPVPAP